MTPLKLSRGQQLYVLVVLLVVLPLLVGFAFERQLYSFYLVRLRGPELQRHFGFTAGDLQLRPAQGPPVVVFAITSIEPGGALGKAGFLVGDIPVGHHDFAAEFYQSLISAQQGTPVRVSVISSQNFIHGLPGRRTLNLGPHEEH